MLQSLNHLKLFSQPDLSPTEQLWDVENSHHGGAGDQSAATIMCDDVLHQYGPKSMKMFPAPC